VKKKRCFRRSSSRCGTAHGRNLRRRDQSGNGRPHGVRKLGSSPRPAGAASNHRRRPEDQ
jgi:hypothetical protein